MQWVTSRTDWGWLVLPFHSLPAHHKSPLISILHHYLFSFVGDAPYCTPEQYKECADPALGEHPRPGAFWGEGRRDCQPHA